MATNDLLAPLLTALRDLTAWLRAEEVAGIVIGGVAASLLGRPRATRDVAAVLDARQGLDLDRVRRWTKAFADALDSPELVAELDDLIARRPQ